MDTTTGTHHLPLSALQRRRLLTARSLGTAAEELAATHLAHDHRLEVIARNWRIAAGELRGELDVVAVDPRTATLVVCEVKARRDADRFGGAVAAFGPTKARRLRALTGAFLRAQPERFGAVRLELVAVDLGRRPLLTHVVGVG